MMWKRTGGVQNKDEGEKEGGEMLTLGSVRPIPFFAADTGDEKQREEGTFIMSS